MTTESTWVAELRRELGLGFKDDTDFVFDNTARCLHCDAEYDPGVVTLRMILRRSYCAACRVKTVVSA